MMALTRVWAKVDDDLLGRLDEIRQSRSRGDAIERILRVECDRPKNALIVVLQQEPLEKVEAMAIAQKRTVEAQVAWMIEEFCNQEKTNA
jgi:predicted nucleic acid-binding protein